MKKINSLQALRTIAFLGVFLTHCEITPNLGGWGVSVFFVLSGFLMSYGYIDKIDEMDVSLRGNASFAINKMKKLYPLHIIMMIAALLITIAQMYMGIEEISILQLFIQVFLQTTLLQTLVPISGKYFWPLNGLSWYLSVTMILYFFFPWILRKIKKYSKKRLLILSATLYLVIFIIVAIDEKVFSSNQEVMTYFNYVCPFLRLCDFTIGSCFGLLFIRKKNKIPEKTANILELIFVILAILSIRFHNIGHATFIGNVIHHSTFLYVPTSVGLVYLFAENKGFITKLLTKRLFIYIGNISPYAYLIHQKVIAYLIIVFTHLLRQPLNLYVRAVLAGSITLVAIYCYQWVTVKVRLKRS